MGLTRRITNPGIGDQQQMSNHLNLVFTKIVYGMLHLFVQHQCSLMNEIGPPTRQRDTSF